MTGCVVATEPAARECVSTEESLERQVLGIIREASPPRAARNVLGRAVPQALDPGEAVPATLDRDEVEVVLVSDPGSLPSSRGNSPTRHQRGQAACDDDDELLAWAFGGKPPPSTSPRPRRRRRSGGAQGGPTSKPRYGMLGWDERLKHFGKRGKLPKLGLLSPNSGLAGGADVPAITLTTPSFRGQPDMSIEFDCGRSSSSSSLDELLLSIEAGRMRRRRRRSLGSSSSASSSSDTDSSSDSDSSSTEPAHSTRADGEDSAFAHRSPTSSGSPLKPDGTVFTTPPLGPAHPTDGSLDQTHTTAPTADPMDQTYAATPESPQYKMGADVPAPQRSGTGAKAEDGGPGSPNAVHPARRPSVESAGLYPFAMLQGSLVHYPLHNFSITSCTTVASAPPQGSPDMETTGSEEHLSPIRTDSVATDTDVTHLYRGPGKVTRVISTAQGVSLQVTFDSGEVHTYKQSSLLKGKLWIGKPSSSLGCSQSVGSPLHALMALSSSHSLTGDHAADRSAHAKLRTFKALRALKPDGAALGWLWRIATEAELRKKVLKPRCAADFKPGLSVVHERRGLGQVVAVNTEQGTVAVEFVGGERQTYRASKLLGGRLQPESQLPRVSSEFQPGMSVMHDRRGSGAVLRVDSAGVTVRFGEGEVQTYDDLALARGKLQPQPDAAAG